MVGVGDGYFLRCTVRSLNDQWVVFGFHSDTIFLLLHCIIYIIYQGNFRDIPVLFFVFLHSYLTSKHISSRAPRGLRSVVPNLFQRDVVLGLILGCVYVCALRPHKSCECWYTITSTISSVDMFVFSWQQGIWVFVYGVISARCTAGVCHSAWSPTPDLWTAACHF